MKIVRPALLGIAPGVAAVIGGSFYPSLLCSVLMSLFYVFGVACSFWGGFGIADQCVRTPGKNLLLGFSFTVLLFVINFGPPLAMASKRSMNSKEERGEILEMERKKDAERQPVR